MIRRVRAWADRQRSGPPSWLAVLVIVVLVSAPGYLRQEQAIEDAKDASHRSEEAFQQIIAQRAESRANTCKEARDFALKHNGLVLYLTHIPGRERSPLADDFENKNLVPVRECTPEAIAEFYGEVP